MKKTYINPILAVVKVTTHQKMLTASNPTVTVSTSDSDRVTPGAIEGRGGWFDEDEE